MSGVDHQPSPDPVEGPSRSVMVSAWIGSSNAGDELVHAGLRRLLAARSTDVTAITVDPIGTMARHGGTTITRARAAAGLAAGRRRGPVVLGGGGLLQDQTSDANLPYHLLPSMAGRGRGVAVAGIGLGAGPITSAAGRRLATRALRDLDITVRDGPSADVLAGLGLRRPPIGADLALELSEPQLDAIDGVLAVALRPGAQHRHHLPVSLRRRSLVPDPSQVARLAIAVDTIAGRLGLGVRFIAFDVEKDDALHRAVAERLRAEVVEVLTPDPLAALVAVASATAAFTMRYHAGIAALLGRRPAVLVGCGSKMGALASDVGVGFTTVPWPLSDPAVAGVAAERAVSGAADGVLDAALDRMRQRGRVNGLALDRLLDRAQAGV